MKNLIKYKYSIIIFLILLFIFSLTMYNYNINYLKAYDLALIDELNFSKKSAFNVLFDNLIILRPLLLFLPLLIFIPYVYENNSKMIWLLPLLVLLLFLASYIFSPNLVPTKDFNFNKYLDNPFTYFILLEFNLLLVSLLYLNVVKIFSKIIKNKQLIIIVSFLFISFYYIIDFFIKKISILDLFSYYEADIQFNFFFLVFFNLVLSYINKKTSNRHFPLK